MSQYLRDIELSGLKLNVEFLEEIFSHLSSINDSLQRSDDPPELECIIRFDGRGYRVLI